MAGPLVAWLLTKVQRLMSKRVPPINDMAPRIEVLLVHTVSCSSMRATELSSTIGPPSCSEFRTNSERTIINSASRSFDGRRKSWPRFDSNRD